MKLEKIFLAILAIKCIMIVMKILPKGIIPLYEYPRPQFFRKSYMCLNGFWKCDFLQTDVKK